MERNNTMIICDGKQITANKSTFYEKQSKWQQAELDTFILGAIQGALSKSETFSVPDIVGGKFTKWKNTPLYRIYKYHKHRKDCDNPNAEAGKDVGRIFKYVMYKDSYRTYELVGTRQRQYPVNEYKILEKE